TRRRRSIRSSTKKRLSLTPLRLPFSLPWSDRFQTGGEGSDDPCLSALRFATEGCWSSKPEAGRWAVERGQAPLDLAASACAARTRPASPDPGEVARFLETAESRLAVSAAGR